MIVIPTINIKGDSASLSFLHGLTSVEDNLTILSKTIRVDYYVWNNRIMLQADASMGAVGPGSFEKVVDLDFEIEDVNYEVLHEDDEK